MTTSDNLFTSNLEAAANNYTNNLEAAGDS